MQADSGLVSHCVPSKYYGTVATRTIKWVVLHTVECAETTAADEAVAEMFQRGDRRVSSHYIVGGDEVIQCVAERDVAWCAGHTANVCGIHVEIVGRAAQSEAEWIDTFSRGQRAWLVQLIADICTRNRLPPDRVDVEGAQRFERGVLDHATCTAAFGETNHTDVGKSFPWDEVLLGVRATMNLLQ